jgi:hypothetical protein
MGAIAFLVMAWKRGNEMLGFYRGAKNAYRKTGGKCLA